MTTSKHSHSCLLRWFNGSTQDAQRRRLRSIYGWIETPQMDDKSDRQQGRHQDIIKDPVRQTRRVAGNFYDVGENELYRVEINGSRISAAISQEGKAGIKLLKYERKCAIRGGE